MKLSEFFSGPAFYGEIVIMEPDGMDYDDLTLNFKEAYHRTSFKPLSAGEIPTSLLNYIVREISARDGDELTHAIYFYCTPH